MSWIIPYINFIVLVAAGLGGVLATILWDELKVNFWYWISRRYRQQVEQPPMQKPAGMWIGYLLSILIFLLGGAYTAAELLPKPIVYVTSPVEVGRHATVTVKTVAGTSCNIQYITPGGSESSSQELVEKDAGTNGICAWCWQIGTNTTPGEGLVTVTVGERNKKTYRGVIEIVGSGDGP